MGRLRWQSNPRWYAAVNDGVNVGDSPANTYNAGGGGGATYPNKPSGLANSRDLDFSQTPPNGPNYSSDQQIGSTDFYQIFNGQSGSTNWAQVSDATAPQSPNGTFVGTFPTGTFGTGHGMGNVFTFIGSNNARRVYTSIWVWFSQADNSSWHPISNKFMNFEAHDINGNFFNILGQLKEGGYYLHCEEVSPNSFFIDPGSSPGETHIAGQISNDPIPLNQWVQIETIIDLDNTIFAMALNGDYTTYTDEAPFSAVGIGLAGLYAHRGGGGETLSETIRWKYDHFHVAWS